MPTIAPFVLVKRGGGKRGGAFPFEVDRRDSFYG